MSGWQRRLALLAAMGLVWFGVFEAALRIDGGSEAAPAFQQLFMPDPVVGHRLRPGAITRFTTAEFSATIAINAQGVLVVPQHVPYALSTDGQFVRG